MCNTHPKKFGLLIRFKSLAKNINKIIDTDKIVPQIDQKKMRCNVIDSIAIVIKINK